MFYNFVVENKRLQIDYLILIAFNKHLVDTYFWTSTQVHIITLFSVPVTHRKYLISINFIPSLIKYPSMFFKYLEGYTIIKGYF